MCLQLCISLPIQVRPCWAQKNVAPGMRWTPENLCHKGHGGEGRGPRPPDARPGIFVVHLPVYCYGLSSLLQTWILPETWRLLRSSQKLPSSLGELPGHLSLVTYWCMNPWTVQSRYNEHINNSPRLVEMFTLSSKKGRMILVCFSTQCNWESEKTRTGPGCQTLWVTGSSLSFLPGSWVGSQPRSRVMLRRWEHFRRWILGPLIFYSLQKWFILFTYSTHKLLLLCNLKWLQTFPQVKFFQTELVTEFVISVTVLYIPRIFYLFSACSSISCLCSLHRLLFS